jgi:hypothetical protein
MKNEKGANVDKFSIGAYGNSMQTRIPIQTMVPLSSVPKQVGYHPYNTIPFVSCNIGNYGMKIIPYLLFNVVEAYESPHFTLKKLIKFFRNVRSLSCFGEKY